MAYSSTLMEEKSFDIFSHYQSTGLTPKKDKLNRIEVTNDTRFHTIDLIKNYNYKKMKWYLTKTMTYNDMYNKSIGVHISNIESMMIMKLESLCNLFSIKSVNKLIREFEKQIPCLKFPLSMKIKKNFYNKFQSEVELMIDLNFEKFPSYEINLFRARSLFMENIYLYEYTEVMINALMLNVELLKCVLYTDDDDEFLCGIRKLFMGFISTMSTILNNLKKYWSSYLNHTTDLYRETVSFDKNTTINTKCKRSQSRQQQQQLDSELHLSTNAKNLLILEAHNSGDLVINMANSLIEVDKVSYWKSSSDGIVQLFNKLICDSSMQFLKFRKVVMDHNLHRIECCSISQQSLIHFDKDFENEVKLSIDHSMKRLMRCMRAIERLKCAIYVFLKDKDYNELNDIMKLVVKKLSATTTPTSSKFS